MQWKNVRAPIFYPSLSIFSCMKLTAILIRNIMCQSTTFHIAQYEINKNISIKQAQISETWHHLALALLLVVHIQICELPHFVHSIRLDSSEWKSSPSLNEKEREIKKNIIWFPGRLQRWKHVSKIATLKLVV